MAASDRCKFDAHIALVSWIAGAPVNVPVCGKAVACYAAIAIQPVSGVLLRIETDVCEEHHARIAETPDYKGSGWHRRPT